MASDHQGKKCSVSNGLDGSVCKGANTDAHLDAIIQRDRLLLRHVALIVCNGPEVGLELFRMLAFKDSQPAMVQGLSLRPNDQFSFNERNLRSRRRHNRLPRFPPCGPASVLGVKMIVKHARSTNNQKCIASFHIGLSERSSSPAGSSSQLGKSRGAECDLSLSPVGHQRLVAGCPSL